MDFTNETLTEMNKRKINYNNKYANWYTEMSKDLKPSLHAYSEMLERKSKRIRDCLNIWTWDIYKKNKLMDLQKVNRCMNNRFCPNCRKWDLAGAIHNLKRPFNKLLLEGYNPYLVTLTIPNIPGPELRTAIEKMNKAFKKLFRALNYSLDKTTKGFSDRLIEVDAALKVLEITYNSTTDTYHPHFHCLFFSQDYDESLFQKTMPGEYSNKRQNYNFYSSMDVQIMKIWTLAYTGQRMTLKNYDDLKLEDLYLCDMREMNSSGIVEILKYTFKDTDIQSYEVFKTIEMAIERKRIRQGYGLLYNLKLEGDTDGEKLLLGEFLDEPEDPEELVIFEIKQLINNYKEYRKISRFKGEDV
ncbi:protein rep [Clostridium pasteurianum]|uniref:protein rep n=1 Tax=Clostridium pasteurianum TaxID=1501 RepID=UPI0022608FD1|nr:protein rep [Clostridium pasteurianum]UZW13173.1 protein rep [Clostridium pasteurianum]